jgi:arylsulfatase A-like enzyme
LWQYLATKWRKPALTVVVWLAIALQGVWVLNATPYYSLRLNPLLGGARTASRVISVGAGEGLEQALSFLESEAKRLERTISWSGGYGSHPQKRKALEFQSKWLEWLGKSPRYQKADCHLFYVTDLQRGKYKEKAADRFWQSRGLLVLSSASHQAESLVEQALPSAIAFVSMDTTRADHLSAYGYPLPTTPFLEKLAAGGVRVNTAISPMPTTDPSHLTMFTGLYPRTHGSLRNGVALRDPTLPNLVDWFRDLGYETGAFVSRKHLLPASLKLFGFDFEDGPSGPERDGGETVEKALEWARNRQGGRFFVWLHLFDPHFPYEPPEPFRSRFESPDADWPIPEHHRFPDPFPREYMETLIQRYDAEIAYADSLVERFFEELLSMTPGGDAPLVILAGDHGETMEEVWERYDVAFDHGQLLNQGQLQVPLLFWWPSELSSGMIDSSAAALVDIAPTVFDLLRTPGFPTQGESLLPRIGDSAREGLAFSQRRARMRRDKLNATKRYRDGAEHFSVQDGRYKLILFVSGDNERAELYDLLEDPLEERDLSETEPMIHDRLLSAIKGWLEDTPLSSAKQEIPEEKLEALRALGYLD